jgi:hypothetical protein
MFIVVHTKFKKNHNTKHCVNISAVQSILSGSCLILSNIKSSKKDRCIFRKVNREGSAYFSQILQKYVRHLNCHVKHNLNSNEKNLCVIISVVLGKTDILMFIQHIHTTYGIQNSKYDEISLHFQKNTNMHL